MRRTAVWVRSPEALQLDCYRYCNLNCEYCNVAPGRPLSLEPGAMPDEVFFRSLDSVKGNRDVLYVAPFMNGEPMLDPVLSWRVSEIKKRLGLRSRIVTNGSVTANRNVLRNPDADVRFTISAASPDVYAEAHGRDLFGEVMNNARWLLLNKFPQQNVQFNFVKTPHNEHELQRWLLEFYNEDRWVFPVRQGKDLSASAKLKVAPGILHYSPRCIDGVPYDFGDNPCNCWSALCIGKDGEIMLCSDVHPKYNFGNVMKDDVKKAWKERNAQGLDNGVCADCSYRRKDGIEFQRKYYAAHR